ncbi:MAG TPA: bifunctional DNA-formamidopyrimidine glycosylase/DNA-(apurinic or apyrimidinic site) lyase [Rhodopila sp.]
MPELPEVETVMRGLRARLEGRVLLRAVARRPDLRWPLPPGLVDRLTGARVTGFRRRGKYILMRLDNGWSVLLHLGMSGRMLLEPVGRNDITLHEHLELETDEGWRVGFVDPRRFGSVDLIETEREDAHRLLAGLGPEPLEDGFSVAVLTAALLGKKTPIKAALLDQRVVAGLGNIYVCEALFRAAISPQRLAHTVPGIRAKRLVPAIKQTLTEAIAAGGSSLRDYVQTSGELGYFQHAWKVYGREGEPCPSCPSIADDGTGTPCLPHDAAGDARSAAPGVLAGGVCDGIRRIVQAGRSTFYCARIQR